MSAAEKPTREAIVAYNDECQAAGVQADFIAKFGGDYAGLDLNGVDFSGPHAVGKESNLRGANFRGANLRGARFGAAVLERASFRDADLRDAWFVTANLKYVNLLGSQLSGASIRESDLSNANAAGVDFNGVDLSGTGFPFADLRNAKFAGAKNEYWADFTSANLAGADLTGFRAYGSQFYRANLRGANLTRADIGMADFHDAELDGAVFDDAHITLADFRYARGLSDERRRELVQKSGIVEAERMLAITSFLDSPWFALLLVVVIPVLVWLSRRLSHRHLATTSTAAATEAVSPPPFQFTLAGLLAAMFIVAAMVGTAMWSGTGFYSLAMVVSFYLMLHPVLSAPAQRRSALRLIGAAAGFAVASGVLAFLTLVVGPSAISVGVWVIFGILIGPLAAMVGGAIWAAQASPDRTLGYIVALGYFVWLMGVAVANLWALAQLFAGV